MTRMRHPEHGFTETGDGLSIKYFQQRGWVVDTPVKSATNPKQEEVVDLKQQYFEKFGKKPHHFLSTKSIQKELDGNSS